MLIVIGFSTYYVIPYGFINQNLSLVTTLLNLLLVMIIIGLTLICVLLFPFVEWALLQLTIHTCCRKDKRLLKITETNM